MATTSLHPKSHNSETLSDLVDELGVLQSDIKRLQQREKALKEILAYQGEGEFTGAFFGASVKTSERTAIDTATIRKLLSPEALAIRLQGDPRHERDLPAQPFASAAALTTFLLDQGEAVAHA
jgi:hypothetical protein